jgi:peptidoglycan/LPS O-acetylase OafA/YrhL
VRLRRAVMRDQSQMGSGIDTTLMLALAAWIIVNSHLEQFYPYRWLAADGLLGNTMFFFLSGFGVQSSLLRSRQEFTGFAIRRIVRLYPSVVLASAIFLLLGLRPSVEMA